MGRIYEKLVRDNIPRIIEKNGGIPLTRTLEQDEYIRELDKKLREELDEYLEDGSMEEMADLMEVARAIILARGYTWEEVEEIRKAKAAKNGAFNHRVYLQGVETLQGFEADR